MILLSRGFHYLPIVTNHFRNSTAKFRFRAVLSVIITTTTTTTTTILLLLLLLLLLQLTVIELLLVGSCPSTRTEKTNKNKYT